MADRAELDVLAGLRRTFEALELRELLAERPRSESDELSVRDLTSIARAKRELSIAIRAEIDAQRAAARQLTAEEQADALVEAVHLLPVAQQSEVLRRLLAELTPAVQQEATS